MILQKYKFINKFLIFIVIGIVIFIALSTFVKKHTCPPWELSWSEGGKYYASPEKVVVEPWKGDHNIYGIFQIPNGYAQKRVFIVTIANSGTYCGFFTDINDDEDVQPLPGHYLVKGFFRTRIGLSIIIHGQVRELAKTANWKVGYLKQAKKKDI
ncbi:MAG: hypothetical protein AAF208_07505 [Cyanobacteria bacterium P01_A01_bin.45]